MAVRKVAIVIHGGVQALDVAGPVDVFGKPTDMWPKEAVTRRCWWQPTANCFVHRTG